MKTLLLALVVVAFVCLDSVSSSHRCFECTKENHWYKCLKAKLCPWGHNMCYTWHKPNGNGERSWAVKGCAKQCPTPGPDESVRCCFTQECNNY